MILLITNPSLHIILRIIWIHHIEITIVVHFSDRMSEFSAACYYRAFPLKPTFVSEIGKVAPLPVMAERKIALPL